MERDGRTFESVPPANRERMEAVVASSVAPTGLVWLVTGSDRLEVLVLEDSRARGFFRAHGPNVDVDVTSSWGSLLGSKPGPLVLLRLKLDASGEELTLKFELPRWLDYLDRIVAAERMVLGYETRVIGLELAADAWAVELAVRAHRQMERRAA